MPDRQKATIAAAVFYGVAIIFLLFVIIGNVSRSSKVLTAIYFFKLDLSNIIPTSVSNAVLLNSVARSMGLHDFYQVGLWNFCEGYNDEGVTDCSKPTRFFWFNPVEVLLSELLAGATIAIPTQVTQILDLLKLAQQIMFGLFLSAIVLAAVLLAAATPLVPRSRLWSIPAAILGLVAAVFITGATVLATVMSVGAQIALTSVDALNIRAQVGKPMFAFMWIATFCIDVAAIFHVAMACFCAPYKERPLGRASVGVEMVEPNGSSSAGTGAVDKEDEGVTDAVGNTRRPRLPDFFVKKRKRNTTTRTEGSVL